MHSSATSVNNQVDYNSMVPDEIFVHIFKYLPLEDRKNIRLTCHWFYELCDVPSIRASEVIVLHGDLNSASALQCLSKSSRKIQNIKLKLVRICTEDVSPFFEQQGANVQSIDFNGCTFDPGALKCIIERCVNLRNFTLKFDSIRASATYSSTNVLNDFEHLETESIIRESVKSLSLTFFGHSSRLSNRKFLRFFTIFPRIRELIFIIEKSDDWNTSSIDLTSDTSFNLSCIYDRLSALADQLEVLKFGVDSCLALPFEPTNDILNIRMKNLKELSLKWDGFHPDFLTMRHSSLFQQLTRFNCLITCPRRTPPESVALLMQQLLTYSPLRRLKITGADIPMNLEFFHLLLTCELEILQVDRFYGDTTPMLLLMNSEPSSSTNALVPNYRLQYLFVYYVDYIWQLIFAFYFRSVKYLQLEYVHPSLLENIFKHRSKIHGLCLRTNVKEVLLQDESYSKPWLKEEIPVNSEFQYLVELKIMEEEYWLISFLFGRYQFPALKMLDIAFESLSEDNEKEFWQLIRKLPKLECLKVQIPCCKVDYTRELVGFSKLRHCEIVNKSTESDFIQEFSIRKIPSLRTFILDRRLCEQSNNKLDYFFLDVMSNVVANTKKGKRCAGRNYKFWFLKQSILDLDVINDDNHHLMDDNLNGHLTFSMVRTWWVPILCHIYPS